MIPDTVKIIAESAFENCGGITEVVIPDSVAEVGRYAFRFCDGVEKMTLGKHIKHLGFKAGILGYRITEDSRLKS